VELLRFILRGPRIGIAIPPVDLLIPIIRSNLLVFLAYEFSSQATILPAIMGRNLVWRGVIGDEDAVDFVEFCGARVRASHPSRFHPQ
jgi:hypothetical protein